MSNLNYDFLEGMKASLENAKQLLVDSEVLGERGSIGHATSLAILGFEEAQKAYLLSFFHPEMISTLGDSIPKKLRRKLRFHKFKLSNGILLLSFVQYLLYQLMNETEQQEFREMLEKLKKANLKYDVNPDVVKQKGLYVDPFRKEGIWSPASMPEHELERGQKILRIHLQIVQDVFNSISEDDFELSKEYATDMKRLLNLISKSRSNRLATMKRHLSKLENMGDLFLGYFDFIEEFYGIDT